MPDVIRKDIANQSKRVPTNSMGPVQGKKGPTNWANESKTRGHKASGRSLKGCESTYGGKTKLASLKRGG